MIPASQEYSSHMTVYARVRGGNMSAGLAVIQDEISKLDPNIVMENRSSVAEQNTEDTLAQRIAAWCMSIFGIFGLGVAALGIYGVIAYDAVQRTKELGIRMALGARPRHVVIELIRPVAKVVVMSMVISLPVTIAVARLARELLYGISPLDPVTMAAIPVTVCALALLASAVPAWHATRVDPVISLRVD
jgi:ABC-type lipoprotein release transport system permease subunit